MTANAHEIYDGIVIGGGVGGLTAAAYLARAGARVLVLEALPRFGGFAAAMAAQDGFSASLSHVVYALEPRLVRDLDLARFGLRYVQRDMRSIALGPGGRHLELPRRRWSGRSLMAGFTRHDAENYPRFKHEAFALARRLKPLWNGEIDYPRPGTGETALSLLVRRLGLSDRLAERLEALSRTSAAAYLDGWFENDALKAGLGFDASLGGFSPHEAGSALMLLWRHAQGRFWQRGAVAQIKGGTAALALALEESARRAGAELLSPARVEKILFEGGRASGVVLASGEVFRARGILSSLDERSTLFGLMPPQGLGFGAAAGIPDPAKTGAARMVLKLNAPPPFAGLTPQELRGRLIIADRPESGAEAKGAALTGDLAMSPILEATVPTAADPGLAPGGASLLSLFLPLLPVAPKDGWEALKPLLLKRTLNSLESVAPGIKDRVVATEILTPAECAGRYGTQPFRGQAGPVTLLSPYVWRVKSPVPGLYFCGASAEPVDAISGQAARIAASLVVAAPGEEKS